MRDRPPRPRPQWDLYEDLLLMAMGVERLEPTLGVKAFRGVFMPSFHGDACITVHVRADGGIVELVSLDLLGRMEVMELIGVSTGHPGQSRPPTPPPTRARAELSRARARRFASEMNAIDRRELLVPKSSGVDGIELRGEIADAATIAHFSSWSPCASSASAHCAFFAALYRLAVEVIEDPSARLTLENLHGYLDQGLPVVDLGGVPRRLRLFGRLSIRGAAALQALFVSLGTDDAVVMDLGNFEGMGTALYPLFRDFAGRPGPTTWCASVPAHEQLVAAGVKAEMIFDRIEDAIAACSPAPP